MINPDALVIIFTSCGGENSSIFVHAIVSTDTAGFTTTELPVAFQIRTPYRCRDGSELHIIVALEIYFSVNFILSNAWMNQIGDVLDYGSNQLRVPLQDDLHNFRLTYRAHQKSVPSPDLRSSHDIAFMAINNIEGLLSVMTAYNPNRPWIGSALNMVCIIQASATTGIPTMPDLGKLASSFLRK